MSFITNKSFILNDTDNILFFFICLTIAGSTFLSNNQIAPFFCIIGFLYLLTLIFKKGAKFQLNKSTFCLILYFLTAVISTINSTMPAQSFTGLSKTILYLVFFCAILQVFRLNKEKIPLFALILSIFVSAEVVIAFIQNYCDVLSAATWQDTSQLNPELVLTRVYGTLKPSNPNLFGGFLIAAVPFVWLYTSLKFMAKDNLKFIIGLIFSVLSVPAIFMTGCRGAYLALFIMLGIVFVSFYYICKFHYPKIYVFINNQKKLIITSFIAFTSIVMILVPKISHRILSMFAMRNDSSTSFRMNVYNSSVQMFQDNFLMGIGCGNKVFREIYGLYMLSGFDALSAYSIYLEIAVESGIFALIFFIGFLYYLLKTGIQSFFASQTLKERLILTAGILSVAGIMTHGFVDTVFFRPQTQLVFWSAAAMIYSTSEK